LVVSRERVVSMQQCVLLGGWKASLACRRHPCDLFSLLLLLLLLPHFVVEKLEKWAREAFHCCS
jgi:hypothetical protein